MIVVIQCASTKQPGAGHLRSRNRRPVIFIAEAQAAPNDGTYVYAQPDDRSDHDMTWRELLLAYNESGNNPDGLYPAYRLYGNAIYGQLAENVGLENLYILSAGWGLINAQFLTPYYNITFSPSAERYKRRRNADRYEDFCMLPSDTKEPIVFFGGKDYVPLFCKLTKSTKATRTVYFNSAQPPVAVGCTLERFETSTRTNWHYECAKHFLSSRRNR